VFFFHNKSTSTSSHGFSAKRTGISLQYKENFSLRFANEPGPGGGSAGALVLKDSSLDTMYGEFTLPTK
jgi:formiminotetrahydrofolate cyclodeaminase